MSAESPEELELDARRLGVFEIARSKRRIAFKIAPGRTAVFDRWVSLFGFFALYFIVLAYVPSSFAWAIVSVAGMVILSRASKRYAADVALRRSRFPAIEEPLEVLSTRKTANEYDDDARDPYRAPPIQAARFDSIVIDGRVSSLGAVECFRLAKYRNVQAGYVILEMRERDRDTVRYQVTSYFDKYQRAKARRLLDVLANVCGVPVGETVALPLHSRRDYDTDTYLMILEVPVVTALVLLASSWHGAPAVARVAGAVIIGLIDWFRTRRLVRTALSERDVLAKALDASSNTFSTSAVQRSANAELGVARNRKGISRV